MWVLNWTYANARSLAQSFLFELSTDINNDTSLLLCYTFDAR